MSARVLAVDDTPALRALLQLCLTKAGYRVDLAEEGQSAVEMFLAASYGFRPLSEEGLRIEAAAKAGDASGVLARLEAVKAYLGRVSVVYR